MIAFCLCAVLKLMRPPCTVKHSHDGSELFSSWLPQRVCAVWWSAGFCMAAEISAFVKSARSCCALGVEHLGPETSTLP